MSLTKILITGITGQDGLLLSKHLLKKQENIKIFGVSRSLQNNTFLKKLEYNMGKYNTKNIKLISVDLSNRTEVEKIIKDLGVNIIVNLSGPSSVYNSFENSSSYKNLIINQFENLINGCLAAKFLPTFFQASTSEMFSKNANLPLNENSIMEPRSPYAEAKHLLHKKVTSLKVKYEWNIKSGIMFNHESEFRSDNFLIMKVINTAIEIVNNKTKKLSVGSLDYKRDWSHASDIVKAIDLMINQNEPIDYVIGSGKSNSILNLINYVFQYFDLDYKEFIEIDNSLLRKNDPIEIVSDPNLIFNNLNWKNEINFYQMLEKIIEYKIRINNNNI